MLCPFRIKQSKNNQMAKTYVLIKDCPNLGKEIGDYYNDEYGTNYKELIEKGIIEEAEEYDMDYDIEDENIFEHAMDNQD